MAASVTKTGVTTTDAYAAVSEISFDTFHGGEKHFAFRYAETGGANGATFKVQGSLNGTNYTDVVTVSSAGAEDSDAETPVAAGASAEVFVTLEAGGAAVEPMAARACYRHYRVVVKSTSAGNAATVSVTGFCK